jgi:hypothetical protein
VPEARIVPGGLVQQGLRPDLTLLLDIPVEQGLGRAGQRGDPDRFEREKIDFFERVRNCYLAAAASEPQRIRVIDAARDIPQVQATRLEAILQRMLRGPAVASVNQAKAASFTQDRKRLHALMFAGAKGVGKTPCCTAGTPFCTNPTADGNLRSLPGLLATAAAAIRPTSFGWRRSTTVRDVDGTVCTAQFACREEQGK